VIRSLRVSDPRLDRIRAAVHTDVRARALAFVVVAGLLTAVTLLLAPPAVVTYDVGAVADRAIRAPRSVSFISDSLTDAERQKAETGIPKQTAVNPAVVTGASTRLANVVA